MGIEFHGLPIMRDGLVEAPGPGKKIAQVPLQGEIRIERGGLTAELAEPRRIAGILAPVGAIVWLDPKTGVLEATKRPAVGDP